MKRLLTPLPGTEGFDKYNNAFSLSEVKRIGDEYGVATENLGVYRNTLYFDVSGFGSRKNYAHNNWSRWIMNSSHGFTKEGIEKISESIRAYVYLVLTSQSAARHTIVGDEAPALAAQRIFYDNMEDVINKSVSLEGDIARYQSTLRYARSTSDYSVGKGLYMMPSDMLAKALNEVIEGYNDEIVINTSGLELGKRRVVKRSVNVVVNVTKHVAALPLPATAARNDAATGGLDDHRDEITSVVIALGGLTLIAIWLLE